MRKFHSTGILMALNRGKFPRFNRVDFTYIYCDTDVVPLKDRIDQLAETMLGHVVLDRFTGIPGYNIENFGNEKWTEVRKLTDNNGLIKLASYKISAPGSDTQYVAEVKIEEVTTHG